MQIYVISTQYQPVVSVNVDGSDRLIEHKRVSHDDLRATFNASKSNRLLACDTEESAIYILQCLINKLDTKHDTILNFTIPCDVLLFSSPVIYTVEIDEAQLPPASPLIVNDLVNYANTKSLPFFSEDQSSSIDTFETSRIEAIFRENNKPINIYKLSGLELKNVYEAIYIQANTITERVSLRNNLTLLDLDWLNFFRSSPAAFAYCIQDTFNFTGRFSRDYSTDNDANDIYSDKTWKTRLQATYRWSRQWLNDIGFHLIEILIGGCPTVGRYYYNNFECFLGLTTIVLSSVMWCLGIAQDALAKKLYSNLYDNKERSLENLMFPIMWILSSLLIFKKPHAYHPWTKKAIALAALVAIPQFLVEVLTSACMVAFTVSVAIDFTLKKFLLPGFSSLVAGLIAVVGIIPAKIAYHIHQYLDFKQYINAYKKYMNDSILQNKTCLNFNYHSTDFCQRRLSTITAFVVKHPTITTLSLQDVQLNDIAAAKLAKNTALLKQLEVLDLSYNKMTGKGAILLLEAIIVLSKKQNTKIKLDLSCNSSINDEEMKKIAKLCIDNQNVIDVVDAIQNASNDKPVVVLQTANDHFLADFQFKQNDLMTCIARIRTQQTQLAHLIEVLYQTSASGSTTQTVAVVDNNNVSSSVIQPTETMISHNDAETQTDYYSSSHCNAPPV